MSRSIQSSGDCNLVIKAVGAARARGQCDQNDLYEAKMQVPGPLEVYKDLRPSFPLPTAPSGAQQADVCVCMCVHMYNVN